MPLSDFPSDIILNIADQLDDAGTSALARTNSQVYNLLNEYLYRRDVIKHQSRSLTWAAEHGVEATVQWAIDAGQYFNPIPESFHIALQDAADRGCTRLVELLLNVNGINPNFGGHSQIPPLILAAQRGHSAVVELLLAMVNIDPNVRDPYDATPLLYACQKRHVSIVEQLLTRDDVDPNAIGFKGTTTPLTTVCFLCYTEIIHLLLARYGIDVNLHNNVDKNTPLMLAVQGGMSMEGVVKSLLARDDVDPNIVNSNGEHVLMYAVICQRRDIVKSLLDRSNVDPNFQSQVHGCTALMWASSYYDVKDPEIVKRFFHHEGIDLNQQDTLGQTIKLLLNQEGIDVNRQDALGRTALCWAAFHGSSKATKVLLGRDDIEPNLRDNDGQTPLIWASRECLPVVNLLLRKKGIDLNAKDNHGCTPLTHACFVSNVAIVRLLLSHRDTDPNPVDNNGVSLLAKVKDNRWGHRKEVKSLLRAAGAR
jgi:ankyrin repeat protein